MILQPRDVDLFQHLHRLRFMGLSHIRRLVFSEKQHRTGVQSRLRKLRDHGYIGARMLHTEAGQSAGYVYFPREPAYDHLDANYKRRRLPKQQFLRHALDIVTTQVQFEAWFSDHPSVKLASFVPEWETRQVRGGQRYQIVREQLSVVGNDVVLKPDAALVLEHAKGRKLFFLEADRGTEHRRKTERKVWAYAELAQHPKRLSEKYGVDGQPFGVLFITTRSRKRIKNLQSWNWDRPGFSVWLLATSDDFQNATSASAPIWTKGLGTDSVPLVKG